MGAFKSAVITNKGQALLAKVVYGACKLEFTQIKTSENVLSGDLASRTSIGTIKQAEKIASIVKQNGYSVKVSASFSNKDLTAGYYVRNIGLYAMDPTEGEILYSVSVANEGAITADWMPPYNGAGISSLMVDLITAVSNASNVTVETDPTAFATVAQINEVKEHLTALDNSITTTTERTLKDSVAGGIKINKVLGKSTQGADPTPEAPQEIKSAVVSKIIAHGKNCLKNEATTSTINGVTFTVNADKSVTVNGTATGDATLVLKHRLALKHGAEYKLTGSPTPANTKYRLRFGVTGEGVADDLGSGATFTAPDPSVHSYVQIMVASGTTVSNLTFYPMIRDASVIDNTYEPYTENSITLSQPITLNGVRDVMDEITPNGVIRHTARTVLDGATSWHKHAESSFPTGVNAYYTNFSDGQAHLPDGSNGLFTHFTCGLLGKKDGNAIVGKDTIQIRMDNMETAEELKSWLAENNVTVYYILENPTIEELPVIDQLALRSLTSYDGVTNIVTDSEVDPAVEAEYGINKLGAHILTGLLTAQRNELKIAELSTAV